VLFIDETHSEYMPRTEEKRDLRAVVANVERKCVALLLLDPGSDWSVLVESNFAEAEARKIATDFFRYAALRSSRATARTPADFAAQFKHDLGEFVELAESILSGAASRDPAHLQRFGKLISVYRRTNSRSFLLLAALPSVLPEQASTLLQSSSGYQAILQSGSHRALSSLWGALRHRFNLTVELDTDKNVAEPTTAAIISQPVAEEQPLDLAYHLQTAQKRITELEAMLAATQQQAQQEAIQFFARTLQNRPNPSLDQLFTLHRWLQKEINNGVTLSSELLRIFITLEDVLESLDVVGITAFPSQLETQFALHSDQLGEFAYVEGSPFNGRTDVKTVVCVRPGWRVGATIITPARVKEAKKEE